tara:strand:+ start:258 stop:767 length:510 start_codon:yes stop_codon:yes gene_type:complete
VKSDIEMITNALAGSEVAYAMLTTKYRQRIYRFLRRRINDDAQAEEVTQDVFLDAFRDLKSFRGESQLYTWLCTIAVRKALRQPFNSLKSEIEMINYVTPESLLITKQTVEQIFEIGNKLPSKQLKALYLKEYHNLCYADISVILRCSPLYAKKLVHMAKKTIRKEMND